MPFIILVFDEDIRSTTQKMDPPYKQTHIPFPHLPTVQAAGFSSAAPIAAVEWMSVEV